MMKIIFPKSKNKHITEKTSMGVLEEIYIPKYVISCTK